MTEIDFYILSENHTQARDHFACRLAEKAINLGRHVVIRVDDQTHAESVSEYLWSFKQESFLPHQISSTTAETDNHLCNIVIDWQGNIEPHHDVFINLGGIVPKEFSRFKKLSEIVVQDEGVLTITRANFQFYRERSYPLKSHHIKL